MSLYDRDNFEYMDMDYLVEMMRAAAWQREQEQQERPAVVSVAAPATPAPSRAPSPDQSNDCDWVPIVIEKIISSKTAAFTDALQLVKAHAGVSAASRCLMMPMLDYQVDANGTISSFYMHQGMTTHERFTQLRAGPTSQLYSELNRAAFHLMAGVKDLQKQGWVLGEITPFNTFYDVELDMYRLSSSGHARRVGSSRFHLDNTRPCADLLMKTDRGRVCTTPECVRRVNTSRLDLLALVELLYELAAGSRPRCLDAAHATDYVPQPAPRPAPVREVLFSMLVASPTPTTTRPSTPSFAIKTEGHILFKDRVVRTLHDGLYRSYVNQMIGPHDPVAADFMASVLVHRELRPSLEDLFEHEYMQRLYGQEYVHIISASPAWVTRYMAARNKVDAIKASRQGLALLPMQHNHEFLWGNIVPKPNTHWDLPSDLPSGRAADSKSVSAQEPASTPSSGNSTSRDADTPGSSGSSMQEAVKSPFTNMAGYGFEAWPEPPLAECCHKPLLAKLQRLECSRLSSNSSCWSSQHSSQRSSDADEAPSSSRASQGYGYDLLVLSHQESSQAQQAYLQDSDLSSSRGSWRSSSGSSEWANPFHLGEPAGHSDVDVAVADATVRVVIHRPKRPDTPAMCMRPWAKAAPAATAAAAGRSSLAADAEEPAEEPAEQLQQQDSHMITPASDCSIESSQWIRPGQAQYTAGDADDMADATVRVVCRPNRPDTPAALMQVERAQAATAAAAASGNSDSDSADIVQPLEQARCKTPVGKPTSSGFKLWGKSKTAAAAKGLRGQQPAPATQQQQQKKGHSAKSWAKGFAAQLSKISKLWHCGQSAFAQVDGAGCSQEAAAWSPEREALPRVAGC